MTISAKKPLRCLKNQKYLMIKLIKIYQKFFSPDKGFFRFCYPFYAKCRFYPSCSDYSCQAIKKYGVARGLLKTLKRISKCHPFNPGGYDPA